MKLNSYFLAFTTAAVFSFTSCTDNDDVMVPIQEPSLSVPTTYTFERNGVNSVDFSGQSTRILMLEEMGNYIKTVATNGTLADEQVLINMYSNTNNPFANKELNTSGKKLKDKTASSKEYFVALNGGGSTIEQSEVRELFEEQFSDCVEASQGKLADVGVAGKYLDGTSSVRLFSENGIEPQQIYLKGLMGACLLDQTLNHYLSSLKLDENTNKENNTNKTVVSGTSYTAMEHNWDEAYGYIYGAGGGKFWDSYINQVNADSDFNTVKENINLAFRKGRAAILANDYVTRDAQINNIKTNLALVTAVRAVFYLKDGKNKLTTDKGAKAFHSLSEAYGFIMCLRYTNKPRTNNPYFSKTEVEDMLNQLLAGKNGFWDVDYLSPKLDSIATTIANRFGFTVEKAATVN